jgi:prolyl oligopeptidase
VGNETPTAVWQARPTPNPATDLLTWQIITPGGAPGEQIQDAYPSGVAWTVDGAGFFYDRLLPFSGGHALYYHACGTPQRADSCLLYEPGRPDWYYQPHVSENGRWLAVVILNNSSANRLRVIPLAAPDQPIEIITRFTGRYDPLGWQDDSLFVRAVERDAPHGRILAIHLPGGAQTELIGLSDGFLLDAAPLRDGWVVSRLDETAVSQLIHYTPTGQTAIPLPGLGTVEELTSDPAANQIRFTYSDYTRPPQPYVWQPGDPQPHPIGDPPVLPCDPADFVTRTVQIASADGATVPIFYAQRRDLPHDQSLPTLLTAYGGLGVCLTPRFAPDVLAWLEMGGRFVAVCARGGCERGARWQETAVGRHKQRTFDDVTAVARWLIATGQTSPAQLGLWGASNGGLTAGVCLTQTPDLFGAVVIESGLLDMLDYHRLGQGANWLAEYGSPDDPALREALAAYSPLHNLTRRAYPATLIATHAHDPRVGEAHSLRFAHALQAAQTGNAPITLRVYPGSGHGDAPPRAVDRLAFLAHHLGLAQ